MTEDIGGMITSARVGAGAESAVRGRMDGATEIIIVIAIVIIVEKRLFKLFKKMKNPKISRIVFSVCGV